MNTNFLKDLRLFNPQQFVIGQLHIVVISYFTPLPNIALLPICVVPLWVSCRFHGGNYIPSVQLQRAHY